MSNPTPKTKSASFIYITVSALAGVVGILMVDEQFMEMVGVLGFAFLYAADKYIQYYLRQNTTTPLETGKQRTERKQVERKKNALEQALEEESTY